MNFNELNLNPLVLKAIGELGFVNPTPVQEKTIPMILASSKDIIGLAQTGTGKTAAFGLPMLEKVNWRTPETQALVLCPTRELCIQIVKDLENFGKYLPGCHITAVYGGTAYGQQIRDLKRGAPVIVATPGRLRDLIDKGAARLENIKYLVLDEADIMLNMGFKEELDAILMELPFERQSLLFSATMPNEVNRIAVQYMHEPQEISVGEKNTGNASVEHSYYVVHAKDKFQALKRLADYYPGIYGIVFCKTRASARDLAERMIKEGYNADALHGDLSQEQREYVMGKFRERGLQLLIATDVAARGVDVKDLTHVIHYDLPDEIEVYNHRSGRTGRAGSTGISLAIINMRERGRLKIIERNLGRPIKEAVIPGKQEICEQQLIHLIDRVHNVNVDEKQILGFMDTINEKLSDLEREELIKRFVSLEFNRFLQFYKGLEDIKPVEKRSERSIGASRKYSRERRDARGESGKSRQRGGRSDNADFIWLKVNLGHRDNLQVGELFGLINQSTRGKQVEIGRIDIQPTSTRFQVEKGAAEFLKSVLKRKTFNGRRLRVD